MLPSFLEVVLTGLLLVVPFSSQQRNTFVILDRHGDLTPNWSSTNCTYGEIYSDFNRLQCRVTMHPSHHVVDELREFPRKRGFWTPCAQKRCEIGYELKPRSAGESRIRVNVQGFLSGKGRIEVAIIRNHTAALEVGKLSVTDHWSQETFFISNVTTGSILKILISQPSYPDDLALLDRITIESNPRQPASSNNKYSLLQPKIRTSTTERPEIVTSQTAELTTPGSPRSSLFSSISKMVTKSPLKMTEISNLATPISHIDVKDNTILMKDETESGLPEAGVLGIRMTEDSSMAPMEQSSAPEAMPTQSITLNEKENVLSTSEVPSETTVPISKSPGSTTAFIAETEATVSKNELATEATVAIPQQETTSASETQKTPDSSAEPETEPKPEGTSGPEPESEQTSGTAIPEESPGSTTAFIAETEATVSKNELATEATVAIPQQETTSASETPDSSAEPEPEGSSAPEPESEKTSGTAIPEESPGGTTAFIAETEATVSKNELATEATVAIPQQETSTSETQKTPDSSAEPEPEGSSGPEPESGQTSTTAIPEDSPGGITKVISETEATVSKNEIGAEATTPIPQQESTSASETQKTPESSPEPETEPKPEGTSAPEPEPERTSATAIPEPELTTVSENSWKATSPTSPEATTGVPTKLENNTMAEYSARNMSDSSAPWGLYVGIPAGAILFVVILGVGYFMKKKRGRGSVTP